MGRGPLRVCDWRRMNFVRGRGDTITCSEGIGLVLPKLLKISRHREGGGVRRGEENRGGFVP